MHYLLHVVPQLIRVTSSETLFTTCFMTSVVLLNPVVYGIRCQLTTQKRLTEELIFDSRAFEESFLED